MFHITTIIENSSLQDNLAAEHGLSIYIESEECRILYDTGASPRFLVNAKELDIDLNGLDALVLSHGHYDHTGGVLSYLTEKENPRKIILGESFFKKRYSRKSDGLLDISALIREDVLKGADVPVCVVKGEPLRLSKGVWAISGFVPGGSEEALSENMLCYTEDGLQTDPFTDEVAIVLETENELVLISGCSHIGVVNMCRKTAEIFGRPVTMFIGGTHLMEAGDKRIEYTCRRLREHGVRKLGACHCSGERAGEYFEMNFPGFFRNRTGTKISVR